MPKYSQILMNRYNDTVFAIRQIVKQNKKFYSAWNHIIEESTVANYTVSRNKGEIFSVIYDFLFRPTENLYVKQQIESVVIIMQNKKLQQSILETNLHTNNKT